MGSVVRMMRLVVTTGRGERDFRKRQLIRSERTIQSKESFVYKYIDVDIDIYMSYARMNARAMPDIYVTTLLLLPVDLYHDVY